MQGEARAQRMQRLRRAIAEKGTLHLKDAARLLNISEMTVRRDLAAPDAMLVCLGGYVVNAASPTAVKYTLEQEIDQHTQDKRLACRSAAASIKDGDTIFIDCGTTMQSLADCLPDGLPLSVICYSMNVASIVTRVWTASDPLTASRSEIPKVTRRSYGRALPGSRSGRR